MTDPKPIVERLMEAVTGKPMMRLVRLYTCSVCGKEAQWGEGWSVLYERPGGQHAAFCDPEPVAYACSNECKEKLEARG